MLLEALEFGASDVYLSSADGVSIRKDGQVASFKKGITSWRVVGDNVICQTMGGSPTQRRSTDVGFQTGQHRFRLNIALAQGDGMLLQDRFHLVNFPMRSWVCPNL